MTNDNRIGCLLLNVQTIFRSSLEAVLNSYNKVIIELFWKSFPLFSVDLMAFLAHFAHCLAHIARYVTLHDEQNVLKKPYQLYPKPFKTAS